MSLPVTPSGPALNAPHLVVDRERRRATNRAAGAGERVPFQPDEPVPDGVAVVNVEAGTGAALADLHAFDGVSLATALSRYAED